MTKITLARVLGLLSGCWLASASCYAASSTTDSVTPTSGDLIKPGDSVYFSTDAGIFKLPAPPTSRTDSSASGGGSDYFCSPAGYRFVVQSITPASSGQGSTTDTKAADTTLVTGYFPGQKYKFGFHLRNDPPNKLLNPNLKDHVTCKHAAQWVQLDTAYQFNSNDFKNVGSQRGGFTWGAMVIPYKFYFTDKAIKGNPSTVAYVGYEGWFPGVSLAVVGSAGLGVAPSSSNSATSTTTASNTSSTAATYTLAVGFLATFGGAIKGGLVFGRDYEGSGNGFKYENKTWMALSVGTSF